MIRTKTYILREIKRLEKRKKKLEIESLTLTKTGSTEQFEIILEIAKKELIEITGMIKAHQWQALTDEKSLPKIKVKKEVKK